VIYLKLAKTDVVLIHALIADAASKRLVELSHTHPFANVIKGFTVIRSIDVNLKRKMSLSEKTFVKNAVHSQNVEKYQAHSFVNVSKAI
jgi:hypothetical protein